MSYPLEYPIKEAIAKLVPTATLGSIFNIDIMFAVIRTRPKTLQRTLLLFKSNIWNNNKYQNRIWIIDIGQIIWLTYSLSRWEKEEIYCLFPNVIEQF